MSQIEHKSLNLQDKCSPTEPHPSLKLYTFTCLFDLGRGKEATPGGTQRLFLHALGSIWGSGDQTPVSTCKSSALPISPPVFVCFDWGGVGVITVLEAISIVV